MTTSKTAMPKFSMRPATLADLDRLFEIQLDQEGNYMVAFANRDADDRHAFNESWARNLSPERRNEVILVDGRIIGSVGRFMMFEVPSVGYYIDRAYWGKGVATEALKQFLSTEARPLYARVAHDNHGSIRVLQKNGFKECGRDRAFARNRNQELEEIILKLE